MLLLAALSSEDPAELDAVQARCEGVWEPGEDPFRTARPRTAA
jgi:hypothetical protein